jgi:hypothetical protein
VGGRTSVTQSYKYKRGGDLRFTGEVIAEGWIFISPVAMSLKLDADITALHLPSGHYTYRQFNIQQFYVLPTQCIYMFCVDLRTDIDYFPIQH